MNLTSSYATHDYLKYVPAITNSDATITYTFTARTADEIFFFYPSEYPRKVSLQLNNRDWGTFFDNETDRIVSLKSYDKDETVKLNIKLNAENLYLIRDQQYFWYLDSEVFKEVFTKFNENSFVIDEYTDTYFKGKITVDQKEELLFTSIPYDEGWHIICDGKELPVFSTMDCLLAAEIPQGEHTLELKYLPDCFVQGSVISVMGLALFLLIIILDFTIKRSRKLKDARLQEEIDDFYQSFDFPDNEEKTSDQTDFIAEKEPNDNYTDNNEVNE